MSAPTSTRTVPGVPKQTLLSFLYISTFYFPQHSREVLHLASPITFASGHGIQKGRPRVAYVLSGQVNGSGEASGEKVPAGEYPEQAE